MRWVGVIFMALLSVACGDRDATLGERDAEPSGAARVELRHAKTFTVWQREGYRIVDLRAPIVSWGEAAKGSEQHARIVLLPKDSPSPALKGDLYGATVVRVPAQRIAVNYGPFEAMLTELGINDRLIAVGGVKSYNDAIRKRAHSRELAQIGYGWHSPPEIDALLGAKADLLLMSMGDLSHAEHYERIKQLGVPVVPLFIDAEPNYMGDVDYVRLVGMLTGREAQAEAFAAMVEANVEALKASAARQPPKRVLSAWFAGGDRWMVTLRNADAALLRDAGGINPLQQPDDIRLDSFNRVGTEVLLTQARDIDCWIARDTHSAAFTEVALLAQFKAWREDCMFASDGMQKPEDDAFDYYETAAIRPDLVLGDLVRMLHAPLRDAPFRYVQPDAKMAALKAASIKASAP